MRTIRVVEELEWRSGAPLAKPRESGELDRVTGGTDSIRALIRIVAREAGTIRPDNPIYASRRGAIRFSNLPGQITREDIGPVPGAFWLSNVFPADECEQMVRCNILCSVALCCNGSVADRTHRGDGLRPRRAGVAWTRRASE